MDFLPKQVPMNCGGQFFEVEAYLLNHYDRCGVRDRFIKLIYTSIFIIAHVFLLNKIIRGNKVFWGIHFLCW